MGRILFTDGESWSDLEHVFKVDVVMSITDCRVGIILSSVTIILFVMRNLQRYIIEQPTEPLGIITPSPKMLDPKNEGIRSR